MSWGKYWKIQKLFSYCLPEYESVKDNLIKYKCLSCNKKYSNKLDDELKNKFKNTFKFSNNDINKFFIMLRKGVILVNTWMIETSLMRQHWLKKNFIVT